jgi:WD40 repeat protein
MTDELSKSQGHQAAVQRVQWADPEFGSILASASYDKQVFIWEEVETKDFQKKQWIRRLPILEKEAILDIKFAPRQWGLMLAIAVQDGTVKIHASRDLSNLTQWQEVHEIKTNSLGCNCLSWNPAFDEP